MGTATVNIRLADFAKPPRAQGDPEAAYRRGFHQGAHEILHLARHGVSLEELDIYISGILRAWRDSSGVDAYPPAFSESD